MESANAEVLSMGDAKKANADFHDFRGIGRKLSNWGRWGREDERGTLNFITPERLIEAARLVKRGKVFDLGIPMDSSGPQLGGIRINPVHLMSETGQDQA
jgi:hypothetical protein